MENQNNQVLDRQTLYQKNAENYTSKNIKSIEYEIKIYLIIGSEKYSHKAKILKAITYKNGVKKKTLVGQAKRDFNGNWKVMGISDNELIRKKLIAGNSFTKQGLEYFGLDKVA